MPDGPEAIQENFEELTTRTPGKIIFDGQNYFTDKQVYTYSQEDLHKGIALVFERYDPKQGKRLGYGQMTVYYPYEVLRTIW